MFDGLIKRIAISMLQMLLLHPYSGYFEQFKKQKKIGKNFFFQFCCNFFRFLKIFKMVKSRYFPQKLQLKRYIEHS